MPQYGEYLGTRQGLVHFHTAGAGVSHFEPLPVRQGHVVQAGAVRVGERSNPSRFVS
jgi:hypothetical protein